MVTRMLAAGQEEEEIRNSGILYSNEHNLPLNAIIVKNLTQTAKSGNKQIKRM